MRFIGTILQSHRHWRRWDFLERRNQSAKYRVGCPDCLSFRSLTPSSLARCCSETLGHPVASSTSFLVQPSLRFRRLPIMAIFVLPFGFAALALVSLIAFFGALVSLIAFFGALVSLIAFFGALAALALALALVSLTAFFGALAALALALALVSL